MVFGKYIKKSSSWKYEDLIHWIENGCTMTEALKITNLNVSDACLSSLPEEIGLLIMLETFSCNNNFL